MVLRKLFGRKEKTVENKEVDYLNKVMLLSFQKVKEDTANIFKWLDYLYQQNLHQKSVIAHLHNQLNGTVKKHEIHTEIMPHVKQHTQTEIQSAVSNLQQQNSHHFNKSESQNIKIEEVHRRVSELERSIENRLTALQKIQVQVDQHGTAFDAISDRFKSLSKRAPVVEKPVQERSGLKSTVLRSINRNSKEYIKSAILAIVKKYSQIQGVDLRKMVVEEQGLCSRSSLYRLLEELEKEQNISVLRQGKEKLYMFDLEKSVEQ